MLSIALLADAVIGNIQEKIMKGYKANNTEIILYSYFIGFFYILVALVMSGELFPAFSFCFKVSRRPPPHN